MNKNLKGAYSTLGASNHTDRERADSDFYSTDPLAIQLLHDYDLLDDSNYWECACGNGNLSKKLIELGYNVPKNTDLYDRGYGEPNVNFLFENEVFDGNILTNPPFNLLTEFILKGLELAENKLYIFGRIQTIESVSRWEKIFKNNKPLWICPFVKRIGCYPNDDRSYKNRAVCYAWFIWDNKDKSNETKVKWLI